MNTCKECLEEKSWEDFPKNKHMKTGYLNTCKECKKIYSRQYDKEYYQRNKEKKREFSRRWYKENVDRKSQTQSRWNKDNAELVKKNTSRWRKKNSHKVRSYSAKRRAARVKATPSWLTCEQLAHIERVYKLSVFMTEETGEVWEVDHIVPIQGKNFCGLHVPWNLQCVPRTLNRAKGNRLEETV